MLEKRTSASLITVFFFLLYQELDIYASDLLFADLARLTLDVSIGDKHFNILISYCFIFAFLCLLRIMGF